MATEDTKAAAAAETGTKDLADFDNLTKKQDEGIDVEIKDPMGNPLGFTIKIAGPDSKKQLKAAETLQNERLQSEDISPMTAEDIGLMKVRGLAMSTISWTKFQLDGAIYPFNQENALKLYQRFPWMREQVEAKAGRRAAFMKG